VDPHIAPEQSRLAWGADHVIRMLEEGAATGAPLFVRWDPSEPHLPNVVPEPYASLYDPADIPPWPNFADPLEGKPYIQAQMRRTWGTDGWTWDDWAPLVARYFGEVSLLDAQVGRILNVLDRLGLTENTLVVYSADHGDMTGSHGMLDKHYIFYEEAARVPLIARGPGVAAGAVCDAFVTHGLDLAATFCAAAGVPAPDTFQGESLLPLLAAPDGAEDRREDIYAQYFGSQFGLYSQRMLRDARWKYVFNATAEDELYDLASDPAELTNRITDPACAADLSRLRRRLIAWMEQAGDPLLNQWTRPLLEGARAK
jgi:arylsulfatase A-like enzyme